MKLQTVIVVIAALAVGAVVGWSAKPTSTKIETDEFPKRPDRKSRVSESKSRVKMVTTVVTNTIRDTVTNTVEVMRNGPRGAEGWLAEMEKLKEENPAEYAARTNRMATFRNRMLQRAENRLETLSSIDTSGWSKQQVATHERYQDLIAKREELMDILRPDSGSSEAERKEAMMQMRQIGRELHATGQEERDTLLSQTLGILGYTGSEADEIKEAISTIYSTTQDWGGPPHGGGRREPPPR